MRRGTYARIAGFMLLFYIANGVAELVIFGRASGGAEGAPAVLASLAEHAPLVRAAALLTFLTFLDAVVLAVALYVLTREVEPGLAMLALVCRVAEGVLAAWATVRTLGLLSVALSGASASGADLAAARALGGLLLREDGMGATVASACFAVGSTLYSYLLLRGRIVPVALARLGVLASLLLVAGLSLQLSGLAHAPFTTVQWIPIALFEVALALWLLVRGAAPAAPA